MGTRHLIAVQLDGEYRVAQYGQWDGYPGGQGSEILLFLKYGQIESTDVEKGLSACPPFDVDRFKERLRQCRYGTQEEFEAVDKIENWKREYPWLSRDAGAHVLEYVYKSESGLMLANSIEFTKDSLFCEYAYVIDLDKNVLEVYRGANHEPVPEGERFYYGGYVDKKGPEVQHAYYPVKLWASFDLAKLPTDKEFLEVLSEESE